LSNIYLHEVFDRWFAEVVRERMKGKVMAVRYADDLCLASRIAEMRSECTESSSNASRSMG
jgi:hypothetical protein